MDIRINENSKKEIILIVATGRSGSTTLQQIINTIPNSNITGENNGIIINLLEFYINLKKSISLIPQYEVNNNIVFYTYKELIEKKIKPCWYNCFDLKKIIFDIQNLIISILDNNNNNYILGFKEIRWFDKLHLLNEFIELFPKTKIICNIRIDILKQSNSDWWKNNIDSYNYLQEYNDKLIEFSVNKPNFYLLTMENMLEIEEVKKLFLFLEKDLDVEKYNYIINNKLE
jgi:hypothetical protein